MGWFKKLTGISSKKVAPLAAAGAAAYFGGSALAPMVMGALGSEGSAEGAEGAKSSSGGSFLGGFGSAIVGGGLDFLNSVYTSKQNQALQDKAFAQNVQMWNMQNAYNHPAEQMKRYKEAGLNPNLIYGNGTSSAGNASGAPTYQAPEYKGVTLNNLLAFEQLKNLTAQNELINSQNAAAVAAAENTREVTKGHKITNKLLPEKLDAEIARIKEETRLMSRKIPFKNDLYHEGKLWLTTGNNDGIGGRNSIFEDAFPEDEERYRRILENKYGSGWHRHYGEQVGSWHYRGRRGKKK